MEFKPLEKPKSCGDCKFGMFKQYGYSDYTVEGSSFYCLLHQHPDDGFEASDWEDKSEQDDKMTYADKCKLFEQGTPVSMSVESYGYEDELDPVRKQLYEKFRDSGRG